MLRVLLRIEVLKAVKRPAFWVTLGVFAVFNAMATVVRPGRRADLVFVLPDAWRHMIEPAIALGPAFLASLMILLLAPEFRWRTARQNVIDGLGKDQFHWGKILVLASLVTLFFVTPLVIGVLDAEASPDAGGAAFAEPTDLNYMLGYVTALLLWGSAGFMLAALVRAAGPALGLLFVYFIGEQILVSQVRGWLNLQGSVLDYLPVSLYTTIMDAKLYYPLELARDNERRATIGMDALVLPDVWIPLAAATVYAVLFLGLAYVTMRRRDL